MKYPFVKQKDLKDCGVSCLSMLTRYYGGGVSNEYLREITNTSKDGVTAYNLIEGAKKIGFDAYGVNGELENLDNTVTPCIAHVVIKKKYQHFIVIYKVDHKRKRLLIADPNNSKCLYVKISDFKKISTNNYIILSPRKKIMFVEENKVLSSFLYKILKSNTPLLLWVLSLSIIITLMQIFLSFQLKTLLNYVINYHNLNNLLLISLIFISFALIKEFSNFERNRLINSFNHRLDKSMFIKVYDHILSLPYLYYKNRTTGEIVSRMNDLESIRNVISNSLITFTIDGFLIIGTLLTLFFFSSSLTIILTIVLLVIICLVLIFSHPLEDSILDAKQNGSKLNSYLYETINGIETVKSQNIVSYTKKKFLLKYCKYNNSSYTYNKIFILEDFLKNLLISLSNLIILIFGTYLVFLNKLDVVTLVTYVTLTGYVFSPIEGITNLILTKKEASISFKRIKELYEIEEEKEQTTNNTSLTGKININHLKYSYNNKTLLLKNINVDIKPNNRILIYGKSGSGKSTLAKILSGELNANKSCIFYDDKDINKYSISDLRKNICYISSNELIFTDSVYNNIVLDKSISESEFDNITNICLVDEFIENKNLAYDLLLEENGFNISGGQKQRIVLARSLLKNSDIYILDEALNQVDVDRERKILSNLFEKYPNKTFLYISHRFHNADLFDKKYKIEDGVSYEESI